MGDPDMYPKIPGVTYWYCWAHAEWHNEPQTHDPEVPDSLPWGGARWAAGAHN